MPSSPCRDILSASFPATEELRGGRQNVCLSLGQQVIRAESVANVAFTNLSNYFFMAKIQSIALMFQKSDPYIATMFISSII